MVSIGGLSLPCGIGKPLGNCIREFGGSFLVGNGDKLLIWI
jgi:hypothetical protein